MNDVHTALHSSWTPRRFASIIKNDSFEPVIGFMKDEAAPEAAVYAEHLWNLGFRNFGAISHAFNLDEDATELLIDETDFKGRRAIIVFAGKHAGEPLSFFFSLSLDMQS